MSLAPTSGNSHFRNLHILADDKVIEIGFNVVKQGPRHAIARFCQRVLKMLVGHFANKANWKRPMFWIVLYLGLRAITIFMREYGLSPFKKSLKGEHVFLTGAGAGIGRLMAIRLGQMGCKLSLSDINFAGLEETRKMCCANLVPNENMALMQCDVSKSDSIAQTAAKARDAFGPVTILINNAGIVSGKTT